MTYIKHWLDNKEIVFYKGYVVDILIIYDRRKTNEQIIPHQINKVDKNLQFKISTEENNIIHYLDISIYRNNKSINIVLYRKLTETGTVIHLTSNHLYEQKISAFTYYINRLITLPITEKSKQDEWKTTPAMVKNSGYSDECVTVHLIWKWWEVPTWCNNWDLLS